MNDWAKWFQDLTGNVVGLAAQREFVLDPQVEAAKWQALGEAGYYREGMPGTTSQAGRGIDPTVLLIGAAVVVFLLVKD